MEGGIDPAEILAKRCLETMVWNPVDIRQETRSASRACSQVYRLSSVSLCVLCGETLLRGPHTP
jgi:hypothetical protein